jgi:hypothetical protein
MCFVYCMHVSDMKLMRVCMFRELQDVQVDLLLSP